MISAETARAVRERAQGFCEYCRVAEIDSAFSFHVEHVIAQSHRGSDDFENLALACPQCNLRKGPNLSGVDPDSGRVTRIYNPRTQRWQEHFVLNEGRITALTAVGRTTLWLLDMNEARRVRLRSSY
jgi:hypothetical protein